jgi:ribosome modulation factor
MQGRRTTKEDAYSEGYDAYDCLADDEVTPPSPYEDDKLDDAWRDGWRAARDAHFTY